METGDDMYRNIVVKIEIIVIQFISFTKSVVSIQSNGINSEINGE